jgi:hypothetical protein
MDFNIDGEVKFPLANSLQSKVTFAVTQTIAASSRIYTHHYHDFLP